MSKRQCLSCGMITAVSIPEFNSTRAPQYCSKCDDDLLQQTDMSILEEDIAHHRETIPEALRKLETLLNEAYAGYYSELYLVVGGGMIKHEILAQLYFYQEQGYIRSYEADKHNHGAVIVTIRNNTQ